MDHRVKPGGDETNHGTLCHGQSFTSKYHHIERRNAVALGDNGEKLRAIAAYTATLPSDFNQTLRTSMAKSLVRYYAPLDEVPLEIRELLTRLDEQKH
jgi:hypothetical protein